MTNPPIVLIGAGGHALEVLDAIYATRAVHRLDRPIIGRDVWHVVEDPYLAEARSKWDPERAGDIVRGMDSLGGDHRAIMAFGDVRQRARLVGELETRVQRPRWGSAFHPTAVLPTVLFGVRVSFSATGLYVGALAYIGPGVSMGRHVIVNRGAQVSHDAVIGDFVHVAPGAQVLGGAKIGACTLVGANAVILPGVKVGADCRIGAGVVVRCDVPGGMVLRTSDGSARGLRP